MGIRFVVYVQRRGKGVTNSAVADDETSRDS